MTSKKRPRDPDQQPSTNILELFGEPTSATGLDWAGVVNAQLCPFAGTRCFKVRKSRPDVSIGTCSVRYGRERRPIVICPNRLLERRQVFTDCLHLLTLHQPGNELHVVPEVSIPGGSVDYFLVSARHGKVKDFVAIEFQTLDTTGTIWPERQRFLASRGLKVSRADAASRKGFGMNWKMTAKTILVQLHHKIDTLEHIGKRLVLVVQDCLLSYLRREFDFAHFSEARLGDSLQVHVYRLAEEHESLQLEMVARLSTDAAGVARCLRMQAETKIELDAILMELERKPSARTRFAFEPTPLPLHDEMPTE